MKSLEIVLWICGITLIALFFGAQELGEFERRSDVAAFVEAQQPVRARDSPDTVHMPVPAILSAPSMEPARKQSVIAVLRIPAIALEVPVSYGTGEWTLLRGAGLIEGAALPGSEGNVAIAAHRDTHFRALKNLAVGDQIELATPDRSHTYVVTELSVVEPTEVHVLADTGDPVLTLVTCFPFYFVGNAPQRYIVRAVAADTSI